MKNLIAPHGSSTLNPLFIEDSIQRESLISSSNDMKKLLLNSAAAANVVMLGAGYFTPLSGFMDKKNAIKNFTTNKRSKLEPAKHGGKLCGIYAKLETKTGNCSHIEA